MRGRRGAGLGLNTAISSWVPRINVAISPISLTSHTVKLVLIVRFPLQFLMAWTIACSKLPLVTWNAVFCPLLKHNNTHCSSLMHVALPKLSTTFKTARWSLPVILRLQAKGSLPLLTPSRPQPGSMLLWLTFCIISTEEDVRCGQCVWNKSSVWNEVLFCLEEETLLSELFKVHFHWHDKKSVLYKERWGACRRPVSTYCHSLSKWQNWRKYFK